MKKKVLSVTLAAALIASAVVGFGVAASTEEVATYRVLDESGNIVYTTELPDISFPDAVENISTDHEIRFDSQLGHYNTFTGLTGVASKGLLAAVGNTMSTSMIVYIPTESEFNGMFTAENRYDVPTGIVSLYFDEGSAERDWLHLVHVSTVNPSTKNNDISLLSVDYDTVDSEGRYAVKVRKSKGGEQYNILGYVAGGQNYSFKLDFESTAANAYKVTFESDDIEVSSVASAACLHIHNSMNYMKYPYKDYLETLEFTKTKDTASAPDGVSAKTTVFDDVKYYNKDFTVINFDMTLSDEGYTFQNGGYLVRLELNNQNIFGVKTNSTQLVYAINGVSAATKTRVSAGTHSCTILIDRTTGNCYFYFNGACVYGGPITLPDGDAVTRGSFSLFEYGTYTGVTLGNVEITSVDIYDDLYIDASVSSITSATLEGLDHINSLSFIGNPTFADDFVFPEGLTMVYGWAGNSTHVSNAKTEANSQSKTFKAINGVEKMGHIGYQAVADGNDFGVRFVGYIDKQVSSGIQNVGMTVSQGTTTWTSGAIDRYEYMYGDNGDRYTVKDLTGKDGYFVSFKVTDLPLGEHSFTVKINIENCLGVAFESEEKTYSGIDLAYPDGLDVILADSNDVGFDLSLEYTGINPWTHAMQMYNTWKENQQEIDAVGATDTVVSTENNASEYTVDMTGRLAPKSQTAIDSNYNDLTVYFGEAGSKSATPFGGLNMRTLDTLADYEYSADAASDIDIYGGYTGWGRFEENPTGYFHTAYIDGRWWIIDPLGYPFFRTAINTISISSGGTYALYNYNKQTWAQQTSNRLHELGFNSMGGWSDLANLSAVENPLNGTAILGILKAYGGQKGMIVSGSAVSNMPGNVLPFFNPDFEDYAEEFIYDYVSPYATSPYIFGWMSDNEMPAEHEALGNYLTCLTMEKEETNTYDYTYEYAMAWTFIYMETGRTNLSETDLAALCSTEEVLNEMYANGSTNFTKAELEALRVEFLQMVYDRYFSIVKPIFNEVAPNHMYIGIRALEPFYGNQKMMQVLGYYCDVITINYYSRTIPKTQEIVNIQTWANKPFMFTEWYAKGMDACNETTGLSNASGAGWTAKTQDDRGIFYENFALKLLECKYCVGFDWFSYIDNNPNSLTADASNTSSNKGIVSYVGAYDLTNNMGEYTGLTSHMSDVNNAKYSLIEFFDDRR